MRLRLAAAIVAGSGIWSGLAAQVGLEIDHASGRTVLDNPESALLTTVFALDHGRRWMYVVDIAEPYSVTALSIEDGSVQYRIGGRRGDGPGELPRIRHVAAGVGGVFVSDGARISHWDSTGTFEWVWRPRRPSNMAVCALDGAPAIPAHGGRSFGSRTTRCYAWG